MLFEKDVMIIESLLELRSDQNRTRALFLEMLEEKDRIVLGEFKTQIEERKTLIDADLDTLTHLTKGDTFYTDRLEKLKAELTTYRKVREKQFELVFNNKI
jgi:hypothetical protein